MSGFLVYCVFLVSRVLFEAYWKFDSYNVLFKKDHIAIIRIILGINIRRSVYTLKEKYRCNGDSHNVKNIRKSASTSQQNRTLTSTLLGRDMVRVGLVLC